MTSRLREFECTYVHDGNAYTLPVYAATAAAARESISTYASETHGPNFQIRKVTPK